MIARVFGCLAAGVLLVSPPKVLADFINWDVTQGNVDLCGPGWYDCWPGHGLYVDLVGFEPGRIVSKQEFILEAGNVYLLEFDLAGNARFPGDTDYALVQIGLGSVFSKTYALGGTEPFTQFTESLPISETTTVRLSFEGIGRADRVGLFLDDIRLYTSKVNLLFDDFDTENGGVPAGGYGSPYQWDPAIYGDNPPGGPPPSATSVPEANSTVVALLISLLALVGFHLRVRQTRVLR